MNQILSATPCLDANVAAIESRALITPTAFCVKDRFNREGTNQKTLTILAYAKWHGFSVEETLRWFGEAYTAVQTNQNGDDHQNIRALMRCTSLDEVDFGTPNAPIPLIPKSRN